MRRFYYFGCRGTQGGHSLHGDNRSAHDEHLDGGFPVFLLDGTFTPIDTKDRSWKLTHLRFNYHVVSILSCHDNTIDKRPGCNAAFVVVDENPWDAFEILKDARGRFPDCWERLKGVQLADLDAAVRHKTFTRKVDDLIARKEDPPLPLSVIPNYMGINLCSVDSVSWVEQEDRQLVSLTIHFIPAGHEEAEVVKAARERNTGEPVTCGSCNGSGETRGGRCQKCFGKGCVCVVCASTKESTPHVRP